MMENLIEELKQDEGFRSEVYRCSQGVLTIGYGTTLPLSPKESELLTLIPNIAFITKENAEKLLMLRLEKKIRALHEALPWLDKQPIKVQEVLYNMAYQLGVKGVLKFRKTLKFIENKEYQKASVEMLNSLWARQTPNRARRLSQKLGSLV